MKSGTEKTREAVLLGGVCGVRFETVREFHLFSQKLACELPLLLGLPEGFNTQVK
jgi:hypothetical protein